jgi:hypothetical protein
MNLGIERRKHARERADAAVELIWKDESGVASPQPLDASSCLILRAPGIGAVALSQVRNSSWRRTQYHLGIEFIEKAAIQPPDPADEPDYHELLRVGVTGDADRVDRLYRSLAFRYHPDNRETGNAEVFLRIKEAYRILSVSQPRYVDTEVAKPFETFLCKDELRELNGRRGAVLGLLCQRRMTDYRNAAVSQTEMESVTGLTSDELGFVLWYLREKGAVTLPDNSSDYTISAAGIDILESAYQMA